MEIDLTYWGSDDQEKDKMLDIQYAIINKQPLSIVYFNTALQQTERVIEPLRLIFKSHAWYVIGFCRCKQEVRYFRLSRMRRQQLLPEFFERTLPENYVQMTAAKGPTPNLFVLKIRARPEIAYRLYDDFHESQVSLCEDGTYLVTAHFELNEWTCNYLLSFGPYIEVLAPEAVRTMVRERAREIAEHHR